MKKLAALVIIACSIGSTGCGWMVNWMAKEPPPPVLRPMAGMHTIRVTVTNVSASHRLVPAHVAEEIAKRLNIYSEGLHSFAADDAKNADAVLAVSIVEESGRLRHADPQSDTVAWRFKVRFSATLTRADGQVIMSHPMQSSTYEISWTGFSGAGVTPGWNGSDVQESLALLMGVQLVEDLARMK